MSEDDDYPSILEEWPMTILRDRAHSALKGEKTRLILLCIAIFVCLNFFRVFGDLLDYSKVPYPEANIIAVAVSYVLPICLILAGFRRASPLLSFLVVFLVSGPLSFTIDLLLYRDELVQFMGLPGGWWAAYLVSLVTFGTLLGIIAVGSSLYEKRRNLSLALICTGIILFFIQVRAAFLPPWP
jgi:hypothetical protein